MTEEELIDKGWRVEYNEELNYVLVKSLRRRRITVHMHLYRQQDYIARRTDWSGYISLDRSEVRGYLIYTGDLDDTVRDLKCYAIKAAETGKVVHHYVWDKSYSKLRK